jgi:hypothetical protein
MPFKKKKATFPKWSVVAGAAVADELYRARESRLKLQAQVADIETREKELKEYLLSNLSKSKAEGITGKLATVQVVPASIPQVKDWPALYKYILKKKAFELLQRRLTDSAVAEKWEAGEAIPGIVSFDFFKISCNKKAIKKVSTRRK